MRRHGPPFTKTLGAMKRAAKAGIGALAAALIFAGWATLAWNTGLGGEIFIEPGRLIADVAIPQASSTETFHAKSANSPGEAVAQFVIARSLERGLQAWWCAVAFWLIAVPALIFAAIFAVRRHDA
jgi:hypothetical protein